MSFDAPAVLALAPLLGGAVWFGAAWARRARIRRAALWSEETVRAALAAGRLGPTALSLSAFLGVVALAGPRWGEENVVAESRGLSLAIAVDISRSMLAEDANPNRLGRATREARRLVQDLNGDHLGLVVFAGSSYILSPLSVDGSALGLYLDALDPDVGSQGGTGLAAALQQGGELLGAGSEQADRVLVVFTDGEAHDTLPGVVAQAEHLRAVGVHLILVAEGGRGIGVPGCTHAPLISRSSPGAARTTAPGTTPAPRHWWVVTWRPRSRPSPAPPRRSTQTFGFARCTTSACWR